MIDTTLYIFVIYPLGIFIGFASFTMIWMPILIGIPMATYWSLKGCVRYRSIFSYIPSIIFGFVLFTLIGFFFLRILPAIGENNGFYVAQIIGSLFALFYCLKKMGRRDVQLDFWTKMLKNKYMIYEHPIIAEKLQFLFEERFGEDAKKMATQLMMETKAKRIDELIEKREALKKQILEKVEKKKQDGEW